LVYFTSKLAKENPIITHNQKIISTDSSVNPPIKYYKGNGECRTFTLYDQYDSYDRSICDMDHELEKVRWSLAKNGIGKDL
jgi:hypothetical protein